MSDCRQVDYKRASLREGARALFANALGYRPLWRLYPAVSGAGIDDPHWLGEITFNKVLQPHHAHAIAFQGRIAELQFSPENPHLPRDERFVHATLMNGFDLSAFELGLIRPYEKLSGYKSVLDADSTLWTYCLAGHNAWESILREARTGRFREPQDIFHLPW